MSLRLRPHTFTVTAASPNVTHGNVATGTEHATAGQDVRGQITPIESTVAYESFGVELQRPHLVMVNLEDADKFRVNYWITYGTREFRVASLPQRWDAETSTSYAMFVAEEIYG